MLKIKISFLICLLIFVTTLSYSQSGWVIQTSGTSEILHSVFFINSNTGWACGNNGMILKTTNGGTNWIQQTSGIDHNLNSVFFINESTGWICGGKIYLPMFSVISVLKTTNGGAVWQILLNTPGVYFIVLNDIHFIDANTGMVIGSGGSFTSKGQVMKSFNGGMNWTSYPADSLARYSFTFSNSSTGYICCGFHIDVGIDTSFILKTTNYGINWANVFSSDEYSLRTVSCADANNVICGGRNNAGVVTKSQNGGINWTISYPDSTDWILSVLFVNTNYAWATTNNKKIIISSNGGLNWAIQQNPVNLALNDLYFTNSLTGWSVGDSGIILKTTTGGIVGFNSISNSIALTFSLSQNYPNPFNPVTKIKFAIPTPLNPPFAKGGTAKPGGFVRLNIYDVLGREIAALVNEELNPGGYEVEFDGSNYPSGVYFYKLTLTDASSPQANPLSITQKMILIK